jgi:hypothetical protein
MTNSVANKKFGVEIEFVGANTRLVAETLSNAGINAHLEGYNHRTRRHWKVTTDATVTTGGYSLGTGEGFGGELVSPILEGEEGIAELGRVLEALNSIPDVRVDRRCGVHVHISWDGMTPEQIKNIAKRYGQFETEIDSWMPVSRRANNSRWCASTNSRNFGLSNVMNAADTLSSVARAVGTRYTKVNLAALMAHGTIEFRQHAGSTDFQKISNWMRFLAAFCDASANIPTGNAANKEFRRTKKAAYGEIREQFANHGFNLRFAGRAYKLFDANGTHVDTKTFEELEAMYVAGTRRLNDEFVAWFNGYVSTGGEADSVFRMVPAEVADFFNARAAHFAA